jgi:hypothetical protein
MKSKLSLMLVCLPFLGGCAEVVTHNGQVSKPAIEVSIANVPASIPANAPSVILQAKVENDPSNRGVKWQITAGGIACSPACGVLTPAPAPSLSATYVPPQSAPGGSADTPTITATSVANPQKFAQQQFTITATPQINVRVTGEFQSVIIGAAPIALSAQTNDPQGVAWSLTSDGSPCAPLCGSLEFSAGQHLSAIYTPPPVLEASASPGASIQATSLTNPSVASSFSFQILPAPATNYVFLLRGYDSKSAPMAMAGVLTANVNGTITNGELDLVQGGKTVRAQSLQGTFSTDTNFAGIIRGTITIANFVLPDTSINPVFKFVLRGNELEARAVEFDGSGNLASGSIFLQSGASFAVPSGLYAFGVDSDAPVGQRTVEAGGFDLASNGTITGVADQSQAGAAAPDVAEPLAGNASAPDSLGRGALSMTLAGITTNYAYYVVNGGQLEMLQLSGGFSFGTVLSGAAMAQSADFDANNGVFQTSAFQLSGVETPQGSSSVAPDVAIGVLTISPDKSVSLTCDSNNAGVVTSSQKLSGSLQSYDPNTGRGVISIPGGYQAGFMDSAAFYLYDNGTGFVVDLDSSASGIVNRGSSGTLTRQSAGPFSANSIAGSFVAVSGASSAPSIPNLAAAATVPSAPNLEFMAYATSPQAGLQSNVSFSGTFSAPDPTTGRGTAVFPAGLYGNFTPQATAPAVFYLISPNSFVTIGAQPGLISGVSAVIPD